MNHTRIALVLAIAVLLVGVLPTATVAQSDGDEETFEQLESMVEPYNENVGDADMGPLNLAGTNNLYIEDGDSTLTYTIVVNDDNRITAVEDSGSDDAVRKITTDRATYDAVTSADDPAAAFRDAVADDEIRISGEDGELIEGLKWAVINVLKGFLL